MRRAFFINGGIGRILCALPALEYYAKNTDQSVIIVAEAWPEIYALSPVLRNNVYPADHKDMLKLLKNHEIISPEPYRLNAYFNQKANLIQAFDMLINYKQPPKAVPASKSFNLVPSKTEDAYAESIISQIKKDTGKSKVIVFQPLGSSAKVDSGVLVDPSGRSFEHKDIITITKALTKDYAVILMTNIDIPTKEPMQAAILNNASMLHWASIISKANYFIGCDSAGQHFANAMDIPATVVIGATYPENITYPENSNFTVVDLGVGRRIYSPIRVNSDAMIERNNENLMNMTDQQVQQVIKTLQNKMGA